MRPRQAVGAARDPWEDRQSRRHRDHPQRAQRQRHRRRQDQPHALASPFCRLEPVDPAEVVAQLTHRAGRHRRGQPDKLGHPRHLVDVSIGVGVGEATCVPPVREHHGVHLYGVDPQQQIGIVRGVGAPGHRIDAVHAVVDAADRRGRRFRRRRVAVGRVEHELEGAVQARPRVGFVVAVLDDAGHRPRLEGLHEQRAHGGQQRRRVGVQSPRHAVGTEQPGVHQSRGVSSTRTDCITSPTCVCWATSMPSTT